MTVFSTKPFRNYGGILAIFLSLSFTFAYAETSKEALIEKGEYLSILGDCMACHTISNDKPYAGGLAFQMPMGTIVASNITPSKQYGIGKWSREDFSRAVKKGVRPDGSHLYPAMPYTAFSIITEEDITALYHYFMEGVTPVDEALPITTQLTFPFNLPGIMPIWNLLFTQDSKFTYDLSLTETQNRGKYLVDGLTHCSTCHTPRNPFMAEDYGQYLAGGIAEGWHAPNITSDKTSGIGGWSQDELFTYLKTGRAYGKSSAAGPMADAIDYSFQHVKDEDLEAIIAYLQTIPPITNTDQRLPAYQYEASKAITWNDFEQYPPHNNQSQYYRDDTTLDGAKLYNAACATCHGTRGEGALDQSIPSLTHNSTVGRVDRTNLVLTILEGVHRQPSLNENITLMPAFSLEKTEIFSWLSDNQVAAVANYVTEHFGDGEAVLTGEDIEIIKAGGNTPFLIKHASVIAMIGFFAGILIIAMIGRFIFRRCSKRSS